MCGGASHWQPHPGKHHRAFLVARTRKQRSGQASATTCPPHCPQSATSPQERGTVILGHLQQAKPGVWGVPGLFWPSPGAAPCYSCPPSPTHQSLGSGSHPQRPRLAHDQRKKKTHLFNKNTRGAKLNNKAGGEGRGARRPGHRLSRPWPQPPRPPPWGAAWGRPRPPAECCASPETHSAPDPSPAAAGSVSQ